MHSLKNDVIDTNTLVDTSFTYKKLPIKIRFPIVFWHSILIVAIMAVAASWFYGLFIVGADQDQGQVYRIMFVHVPVAWCAFFWVFMGALFSLVALVRSSESQNLDLSAHASMQLGALFAFLVLVTGSIWGRPTWGVWWDWDPRLTSSLIMFILACTYLILRTTTSNIRQRTKMSGFVAVLCALNVPIVYYSVNLWRSLHQPQSFIEKNANVSLDIAYALSANTICLFVLSIAIYKIKRQALASKETLLKARESAS